MSEVMEQAPETATEATERKYTPLTDAQKQAATLRREASLLAKYGQTEKAAELNAQADAIASVRAQGSKRVDPLTVLGPDEQVKLISHFKTTKTGLARIAELVSYKKLAAIVAE